MTDEISYEFTSKGLASHETLTVTDFKGVEALSRPYEFTINLKSESPDIDMDAMLENRCALIMRIGRHERMVHGVLSDFEQLHQVEQFTLYRAVLVPRLWWLSLYTTNEIYLNMSVVDIIEAVLKECNFIKKDNENIHGDYKLKLNGSYKKRAYLCQWRETHLNLVSRLMEHEGIYYYFEQDKASEKIVFCDDKEFHQEIHEPNLHYAPVSGLDMDKAGSHVQSFICRQKRMPRTVVLKDYNYEKPNLDVTGRADVDPVHGKGEVFVYGDNFETPEEGNRLARFRAGEIFCKKERFHGDGMVSRLSPGFLFNVKGHFRKKFNRDYLLVNIEHEGVAPSYLTEKERSAVEPLQAYSNAFTAIPAAVQFRPERITPKPKFYGEINAVVDGETTGKYAELDEQGRYKIRLPFDREDSHGPGKASWWFRKAEPHAGLEEGIHFPLRQKTEVLLSFIDGDPDRPMISNAIANPDTPNVVTGKNQTNNVIRTSSGNLLELEDVEESKRIKLWCPRHNSYFHLGASNHAGDGCTTLTEGLIRTEGTGGSALTYVAKPEGTGDDGNTSIWVDPPAGPGDNQYKDVDKFKEREFFVFKNMFTPADAAGSMDYAGAAGTSDITESEEKSGDYHILRKIGTQYNYLKGIMFNYGHPESKRFNYGNSFDVSHDEDHADTSGLITTISGYAPSGITDYDGSTITADAGKSKWETIVGKGHVTVGHHDSFNIQEGNRYDFGGYWNYDLGNSYEEKWMAQSGADGVELNRSDLPFDGANSGGPYYTSITKLDGTLVCAGGARPNHGSNVWVSKTINGASYDYSTEHDSVEVKHMCNSVSYKYGGREEEYYHGGDGTQWGWKTSEGGVMSEQYWSEGGFQYKTEDDQISYYHSFEFSTSATATAAISFGAATSFSLSGDVKLDAKIELAVTTEFSFSAAAKAEIGVELGVAADIKTGLGLTIEGDFKPSWTFKLKKSEFGMHGPGTKAEKKEALEAHLQTLIMEELKLGLSSQQIKLIQSQVGIKARKLNLDTDQLHIQV